MVPFHLDLLAKASVWPRPTNLEKLFAALKQMKLPGLNRDHADPCDHDWNLGWYEGDYRTALEELKSMAHGATAALCLDCLKSPGGKNAGICRQRHDSQVIANMNTDPWGSMVLGQHISRVRNTFGVPSV
jgi:hypothetical protein